MFFSNGSNSFSRPLPDAFGPVQVVGNSFLTAKGKDNKGILANNSFLTLTASNSELNINQCSQATVDISDTKIVLVNCSFPKVSGKKNTLAVRSSTFTNVAGDESNLNLEGLTSGKIHGNKNEVTAKSDIFLKVLGNMNKVNVSENTNLRIQGSNGDVRAAKNTNLLITGDQNNVEIRNTKTHALRPASKNSGEDAMNKIEILGVAGTGNGDTSVVQVQTSGGWWWPWWRINCSINIVSSNSSVTYSSSSTSDGKSAKIDVEYVDNAKIDGNTYTLGSFNFTVDEKKENKAFEVKIKGSEDSGTLSVKTVSPGEIIVTAEKDGKSQSLRLKARSVVEKEAAGGILTFELKTI